MAHQPVIGQGATLFISKIIQRSSGGLMPLIFLPIQIISRKIPCLSIGFPADGINIFSPSKERFEDYTLILD
jgi:hypothetical protein